jgi:hypothetical protein
MSPILASESGSWDWKKHAPHWERQQTPKGQRKFQHVGSLVEQTVWDLLLAEFLPKNREILRKYLWNLWTFEVYCKSSWIIFSLFLMLPTFPHEWLQTIWVLRLRGQVKETLLPSCPITVAWCSLQAGGSESTRTNLTHYIITSLVTSRPREESASLGCSQLTVIFIPIIPRNKVQNGSSSNMFKSMQRSGIIGRLLLVTTLPTQGRTSQQPAQGYKAMPLAVWVSTGQNVLRYDSKFQTLLIATILKCFKLLTRLRNCLNHTKECKRNLDKSWQQSSKAGAVPHLPFVALALANRRCHNVVQKRDDMGWHCEEFYLSPSVFTCVHPTQANLHNLS